MRTSSIVFSLTTGLALPGLVVGCGGTVSTTASAGSDAGGASGSGAQGGTSVTASSAQSGGGGTGAQGGSGGAGGGSVCGGKQGFTCAADQYCHYEAAMQCGVFDGSGVCLPRPAGCPEDCPGVCGCDGTPYCNACLAHAAGHDVQPEGASCAAPADCQTVIDEIAKQAGGVQTCTALVRLDYQTLAIKSQHLSCGPYGATNEAQARATAQADTGHGQSGELLSGASPEDEYVFWESAGDFGGAGVVNARNGQSVFGGSVVWNGMGQITYPTSFSPPESLGLGCPSMLGKPPARGFDLGSGRALSQAQVDAALAVVWGTALPDGLWQSGYVFDAMVLLYPPSVGGLDPNVAEWVVLVNSGWLE
jgi:hypothetical protein